VVISFALLLGLTTATKSEEILQPDFSGIDFKEGLLSVSIKNQPFKMVMDEVSRKTGRRIVIKDETDDKLTANFDYLPLEAGLRRLLKRKNYVFLYSTDQTNRDSVLTQVLVFSGSGSMKVTGTDADINGESAEKKKASAKKLQELDKNAIDELVKIIPIDAKELRMKMQEVTESIQMIEVSAEVHRALEDALQEFRLSEENPTQKAFAPSEGERGTQGLIIREREKKLSE
jgi:hypothetical protein